MHCINIKGQEIMKSCIFHGINPEKSPEMLLLEINMFLRISYGLYRQKSTPRDVVSSWLKLKTDAKRQQSGSSLEL